ncbi:MAG: ornithine carbamoyltransferase [Clostridia bacterium]|nr:ornithine carbamoyltransferase [Clostridia bacterium]
MDINRYTPSYGVNKKHMLRLADFSTEELFEFLYATKAMKAKSAAHESTEILKGVSVALLFGDTSIRTRAALEIGIRQLGGYCVNLPYSESDMLAGENIKDIVSVISRYGAGALVTRGINHNELNEFCKVSDGVSIINSTNREYVPAQALCDIFTIWEKKGKLEGLKLAYVGKGGHNAASLIMGGIKCGMEVSLASPEKFAINPEHLKNAEQYGKIFVTDNPAEAVRGADIVYTDNYGYHDTLSEADKEILKPYQVNNTLMGFAQHNALFMHSLPATRGLEVTADVIDGKQSAVLDQGENKLHTIKAVLALLIK